MKRAVINCTYQSKKNVKERDAKNKRNTRHATKTAQQAAYVDGIVQATKTCQQKTMMSSVEVPARTRGRITARGKSGS